MWPGGLGEEPGSLLRSGTEQRLRAGSSSACRTSGTPSPTSWAWSSSMHWRSPALCWRSRRPVWSGTGGAGTLAPCLTPFPACGGGGSWCSKAGRETCLYVRPPGNHVSSCPPCPLLGEGVGAPGYRHSLGALHNPEGCGMRGWDWQSPDLHGDEPGDLWEGRFWVTNATMCCLPGVEGMALCCLLVSSPGPSTMPLGAPLPPQLPVPGTQPQASLSRCSILRRGQHSRKSPGTPVKPRPQPSRLLRPPLGLPCSLESSWRSPIQASRGLGVA